MICWGYHLAGADEVIEANRILSRFNPSALATSPRASAAPCFTPPTSNSYWLIPSTTSSRRIAEPTAQAIAASLAGLDGQLKEAAPMLDDNYNANDAVRY